VAVGALSSGCIELPDRPFSCATDGDCAPLGREGASYVCGAGVCVPPDSGPGEVPDAGTDGGEDGGLEPDAGPADAGPVACPDEPALMPCTPDGGWCWDNPLAAGSALRSIRGRSENDLLAAGENGVVLSWDGTCWRRSRAGTQNQTLNGSWAAPGGGWQVVGINGTLLRSEDGGWREGTLGTATLHDISGGSDGSAIAVGDKGAIHRFVDGGWGTPVSGLSINLTAVWTTSYDTAWVFAENGDIFVYSSLFGSESWNQERTGSGAAITGAVGLSDGTPVAVSTGSLLRRTRGPLGGWGWGASSIGPATTRLNDVWHDSGRTWLVGQPGFIYQEDGGTEPSGTAQVLNSVWSRGEKGWAAGEAGVIVQRTGSQWAEAAGGVVRTVNGLGSTSDGLWAAGDNSLLMRRMGGRWSTVTPPETNDFQDVWGSGNVLWVLGASGRVSRYRDGGWTTEVLGGDLKALWGVGPEQLWVVGAAGTIWRRDADGSWEKEPLSGGGGAFTFNAIWGSSAANLWAVGTGGKVYRRDPACTLAPCNWLPQTLPSPPSSGFTGVWGTSGKVWAVAGSGGIHHFDGRTWAEQPIEGGNPGLLAITGRSESELWAVGANGSVVTWDGNNWTLQQVTQGRALNTVVVAGDTVWAGGLHGTIIKHR
jgi:hypothetical protein